MALRFDLSGNPLPGPADRLRSSVVRHLASAATDPRDAEIAALKARVAELEAAQQAHMEVALSAATATATATSAATAKKIKPATDNRNAKLKDEPWKALGLSERTYYRRKAAGTLS